MVGAIPARLLTDECPRYAVEQRAARSAPARRRTAVPPAREALLELLGSPELALARVRHAPLRPARAVAHRAPARARRGRAPAAPVVPRPRASRSTARAASARSTRRRGGAARDPRGGAQRRLRRRRAARLHRLPQLRQPREARDRLGARASRSRGWRRPARRSASRSSPATSRSTTTPTAARSTRRRSSAASASSPDVRRVPGGWQRRRRDPARAVALAAHARRLGGAGPLRHARRVAVARPRGRGRARPPRDARGAPLPRSSTTSRRAASRRARGGGAAGAGSAPTLDLDDEPLDALRRGRRPGDRRPAARPGRARSDRWATTWTSGASARSAATRSSASRSPSSRARTGATPDVRRVRRPLARARRGAAHVLRPLRAAAPRPGVGRHRGLGGRPASRRCATWGSSPQVFDEQKLTALPGEVAIGHTRYSTTGGARWSNAQPLVHHGRARTVALGHNGNLVNAGALRDELVADRRPARVDLRHRGDRRAARPRSGPAPRGRRGRDAAARGRLLGRRDRRTARSSPSATRTAIRPLTLGRIGDDWVVASETLRARPRRRRRRARRAARRGRLGRRGRAATRAQAVPRGPQRRLHLRARLLRPARLAARRQRGARGARADGRAARRGGAGRRRPRDADPRLGHARRDRLREGAPGSRTTRA